MTEEGRLDTVLAAAYPDLSRARVQRLIANEHVLVDGAPARKSTYVERGAQVAVTLPDTPRSAVPTGLHHSRPPPGRLTASPWTTAGACHGLAPAEPAPPPSPVGS